jgi:hypothetical protein
MKNVGYSNGSVMTVKEMSPNRDLAVDMRN